MATTVKAPPDLGAFGETRAEPVAAGGDRGPVFYLAVLGGLWLAFMLFIGVKWVTGEHFQSVSTGVTEVPDHMKIGQSIFMGAVILALAFVANRVVVRPWRREGQISTDGALFIAFGLLFFQDQFSNAGGYWFTYNSWAPNVGNWFAEIPGWSTFSEPGATAPEPILMMLPGYIYFFLASMFIGLFLIRKTRAKWPTIGYGRVFAIVFAAMFVFDFIIEAFIWMPLGFYTYTWAPGPMIFEGTYHQFPLFEAFATGVIMTVFVALRHFTNDRGETVAERGIEKMRITPRRKSGVRLLAAIGATQMLFLVVYNFPVYQIGVNAKDWPEDTQKRSYFMNGICGDGTPRACPTESVTLSRQNPITVTPDGRLSVPPGAALPKVVPLDRSGVRGAGD